MLPDDQADVEPIVVVVNCFYELKRRPPMNQRPTTKVAIVFPPRNGVDSQS
jgi:hypothetical protein